MIKILRKSFSFFFFFLYLLAKHKLWLSFNVKLMLDTHLYLLSAYINTCILLFYDHLFLTINNNVNCHVLLPKNKILFIDKNIKKIISSNNKFILDKYYGYYFIFIKIPPPNKYIHIKRTWRISFCFIWYLYILLIKIDKWKWYKLRTNKQIKKIVYHTHILFFVNFYRSKLYLCA
jgi:hypothetical protein